MGVYNGCRGELNNALAVALVSVYHIAKCNKTSVAICFYLFK